MSEHNQTRKDIGGSVGGIGTPNVPINSPRDPQPAGLPGTVRPGIHDDNRGGVTGTGVGGDLPNTR